MYIFVGNILFAGLLWGYYAYCGGDRRQLIPAVVFGALCFLVGIVMGVIGSQDRKKLKPTNTTSAFPLPDFDNIAE